MTMRSGLRRSTRIARASPRRQPVARMSLRARGCPWAAAWATSRAVSSRPSPMSLVAMRPSPPPLAQPRRSRPCVADGAVAGEANVADFAGGVAGSAIEAAIGDDAGAESGAHGEEDHMADAASCAEAVFGDHAGVGVVLERAGDGEGGLEDGFDGDVVPGGEVGRGLDDAGGGVEGSAGTDADGAEGVLRGEVAEVVEDQVDGAPGSLGGKVGNSMRAEISGGSGGHDDGGFGAADIDVGEEVRHGGSGGAEGLGAGSAMRRHDCRRGKHECLRHVGLEAEAPAPQGECPRHVMARGPRGRGFTHVAGGVDAEGFDFGGARTSQSSGCGGSSAPAWRSRFPAGGFVEAEDGVVVGLGLFDGGDDYVGGVHGEEGIGLRARTAVDALINDGERRGELLGGARDAAFLQVPRCGTSRMRNVCIP